MGFRSCQGRRPSQELGREARREGRTNRRQEEDPERAGGLARAAGHLALGT